MRLFINVIFISLLTSCCLNNNTNLNSDKRIALFEKGSDVYLESTSTLSKMLSSDFAIVDEVLNMAIDNNEFYFLKDKKLCTLKKYYRQYLVYINENDEKIVYINAMCKIPDSFNWKKDFLRTSDGGECYWKIEINLTNKTYREIMVNGYA